VGRLPVLVALVCLIVTATASARNPRLERLALRAVDVQLAKGSILRTGDLGSGWTSRPSKPDDNAPPDCPGQNYSAFTITGQAQAQFVKQGASVLSRVEVYPSRKQVLGDFAVDAQPGVVACEGEAIRREVAKEAKGLTVTLVSAKQLPAPQVGQRSIAFRIVLNLKGKANTLKLYVDLIGFVRDRSAASVVIVAPGLPPKGDVLLARVVDSRLQRAA
jgi:hypothetical protein